MAEATLTFEEYERRKNDPEFQRLAKATQNPIVEYPEWAERLKKAQITVADS